MGFDENVIFCKLRPKLYQSQFSMSKTKFKKSLKKINLGDHFLSKKMTYNFNFQRILLLKPSPIFDIAHPILTARLCKRSPITSSWTSIAYFFKLPCSTAIWMANHFFSFLYICSIMDLENSWIDLANFLRHPFGVLWTISFQASWTSWNFEAYFFMILIQTRLFFDSIFIQFFAK